MNNPRLMGVPRIDNFNLRGSMCVIAMYGVITIISYFNELNKAGLLKRGVYPRPLAHYRFDKTRIERSIDMGNIIEKNGDIHSLGLEILKIKKDTKHKKKKNHKGEEEINIKVHLGKNGSYEKINNSVMHVYDHKNTLPNFYTSMNLTLLNLSASQLSAENVTLISNLSSVLTEAESRRKAYRRATLVYMYQHEPDTYLIRDCLKNLSQERSLSVNNLPISSHNRKQWEMMSKRKKEAFHVLHGSRAFGVCETVGRACNYITLVSHPVDRLVALYHMCRPPIVGTMKSLCRASNADKKRKTLKEFIVSQGSGYFHMLVYYAKHCRLIGEDEICLQDSRTSFIFSEKEIQLHLKHILQHLESWFGAVGLVDHLPESLDMFQKIYGHKFPKCYNEQLTKSKARNNANSHQQGWASHLTALPPRLPQVQRSRLLNESSIATALAPDMAIYRKLVEIYKKQFAYKTVLNEHQKSLRFLSAKQNQRLKKIRSEKAPMKTKSKLAEHTSHKKTTTRHSPAHLNQAKGPSLKHDLKFNPGGKKGPKPIPGQIKNNATKLSVKLKAQKAKPQGRKQTATTYPVAGMDPLLYQNYSILEKHMSRDRKKKKQSMKKDSHVIKTQKKSQH